MMVWKRGWSREGFPPTDHQTYISAAHSKSSLFYIHRMLHAICGENASPRTVDASMAN